jgi:hypothetical protein
MAYKRTSKTRGGIRTTTTRNSSGGITTSTSRVRKPGAGCYETVTRSADGRTKIYKTIREPGGWITKTLVNKRPKKVKHVKQRRTKSKSIKFSTWLIILCTLYLFGVISNI